MSIKTSDSWGSDSQVQGLRIEMSPDKAITLPFNQFVFSEFSSDGKEHRLRVVFATHEVFLRGCNLKRVDVTLQKKELSFVAKASPGFPSDLVDNQPVIFEIVVQEVRNDSAKPAD